MLAGQTDMPVATNPALGGIFENYCILERLKVRLNHQLHGNTYYWRSPDSEIDYLEQYDGMTHAYEIKWRKQQKSPPPTFAAQFPSAVFTAVTKDNFWGFLDTRT